MVAEDPIVQGEFIHRRLVTCWLHLNLCKVLNEVCVCVFSHIAVSKMKISCYRAFLLSIHGDGVMNSSASSANVFTQSLNAYHRYLWSYSSYRHSKGCRLEIYKQQLFILFRKGFFFC